MQGAPDDPGPPGGAPDLPDAAPDAVQGLLDGIWSFGGGVKDGVGDVVAELAKAIGVEGEAGLELAGVVVDVAVGPAGVLW